MLNPAEQRTDAWFCERAGKVTASRIADVMAKGAGLTRARYMADLVEERLTGEPKPGFINAAMQHGMDAEPQARTMYALKHGVTVIETGFITHPQIDMAGASPDGLVGNDGMVEIKCPNTATHMETLRRRKIPRKYVLQMHWQMICAQRLWCDFVSFDPRVSDNRQLHIQRVELDRVLARNITVEVTRFLAEIEGAVAARMGRR